MSEADNVFGLILEGISGTGKSFLMDALLRSERYTGRSCPSSLILSEHQTQRILEKKTREGTLVKKDSLDLLDGHLSYLEGLNGKLEQMEWCRRNSTIHRIPWLFERFHLTHVLHYDFLSWSDVKDFDARLSLVNGKICLLTATEEQLDERLFELRDEHWNSYIKRFGSTRREILNHFLYEQERLIALAEETVLPTLVLNPSDTALPRAVEKVLDFWLEGGKA